MAKLQIGCFIITVFIMLLYFSVKRIKTGSHKVYSALLFISFFYLIFDWITVYTVNHMDDVPSVFNHVMHRCFLISLVTCIYLIYHYVLLMIFGERPLHRASSVFLVVTVLASGILPLYYRVTDRGNYSYGPAAYVTYVGVAVYTVMMCFSLFLHYREMEKKKCRIIVVTILFQVGISVYQALVPLSLVSCLGITLVNIGFFLTVESPDIHLIEQLKEEKKLADSANRAKSTFLANMSHEIRTPLHAITGMSEMILRESSDKEILSYAGDIHSASNALLGIVNDILDFSKIESGRMEIVPVSYQLSSLVYDVYLLIGKRAEDKGLTFSIEVDEKLPSGLCGDDIRLKQILINLLTNAVKYTKKGSVTLQITGEVKNDTCNLHFQVKDTGIGIRDEDKEKLFTEFARLEEKRNRSIEGTGLGINITQQLLMLMNSTLCVESIYGQGSVFSFTLEQKIHNWQEVGDLGKRLHADIGNEIHEAGFRAPDVKVLVTDDIELNRKVFRCLLKQTGIQVAEAGSGAECLAKSGKEQYDLIFMDNMMPDMDGIETLHKLKADPDGKNRITPVIMLTANAIAGAKEEYERAGFDGYLSKPIDPKKMETIIRKFIDKERILSIEKADPEKAGPESAVPESTAELPDLSSFMWDYARLYIPDEQVLVNLLNGFLQTLSDRRREWSAFCEDAAAFDIEKFRIQVHSLKGLSATVGAVSISGLSRILETAARNRNVDKMKRLLPVLMDEMEVAEQELASVTAIKKQTNEEKGTESPDPEELTFLIKLLMEAMKKFDFDEADRLAGKLRMDFHEGVYQENVERLLDAVRDLDDKKAVEIGQKILCDIEENEV